HAALAAPGRAIAAQSGALRNVQPIAADTAPSINGAEPDTVTEPDIAINPANGFITAAAQQGRYVDGGSADPGYATSHNGGRTWTSRNLPLLTEAVGGSFQRASDAAVAFGPDGSDYVQTIPFDQTDARSAVAVQRSTDGGLTFGAPSLVVNDNDVNIFNDKNWIAVDTSRRSPFFGRIYTVWSRFITSGTVTNSPGAVSWSDDHGRTWSPFRFTGPANENTEGLIPLIARDGAVTVVYDQTIGNNDFETAQTSHDGGNSWSAPVIIAQFLGAGVPGMRTGGLATAAIDPSTGRMYVAWQDTRFNSAGLNDIVLSTSSNGRSWSAPRPVSPVPVSSVPVSPGAAGLDRFTPAVAAAGGKVYISYRTRAASGTAPTVSEDLIVSRDSGFTFGPERQIGPPAVLAFAAVADTSTTAFLGDYMGLAATRQLVALAWCVSSPPPVTEPYHQLLWGATMGG
ncbi:MAG TPA: sialidase family protein, partial [Streptosporangiaceae bacterium]